MTFRNVGGRYVVLQREGRGLGDGAFAAPGTVTRDATGSVKSSQPPMGCLSTPLQTPDCTKVFAVRSDLAFGWSKGRLTLQRTSSAGQKKNPAENCGMTKLFNFTQFQYPYPTLDKQTVKLPVRTIFGSKRHLRLEMSDRFLGDPAGLEPTGYTSFEEKGGGSTTVTLKRLGR
jgi:hypothetical protein